MDILQTLTSARELYHSGKESFLSDAEYDALEEKFRNENPSHVFFTGIGSEVRKDKVKLPYTMGSLDQLYENDTAQWIQKNSLQNEDCIISAKMDGVSVLLVYNDNGQLQIAYSRGDGIEGQDITRHIKNIPSMPNPQQIDNALTVRAECIISKSKFKVFQQECISRKYKAYKNPRNAVAGLMNSKSIPEWIYQYIEIVTYEIIGDIDKSDQLELLYNQGFNVVPYKNLSGKLLDDATLNDLIRYNKESGSHQDYEQDGVVIDINNKSYRKKTTSLNPSYAKKFKIREDVNNIIIADVINVKWAASKHGLLKPRVEIDPIELNGVTITYATGFNAKFIIDNMIGNGAKIKITRSGDVIPHIIDIVTPANEPALPSKDEFGDYTFNETGVDFVLLEGNEEVKRKSITSFFASLDIPLLKEASIKKLIEAEYDTIPKIINMEEYELIMVLGKNGIKVCDGITERLNNLTEYDFIGSMPFFIGVGKRMFKKLYDKYGKCYGLSIPEIMAVDGFDEKTANKIYEKYTEYDIILKEIDNDIVFTKPLVFTGKFDNQTFVFTGIRDKDSEKLIESYGGKIGNSINKNITYLVAKDVNSKSGKLVKARSLGISIIDLTELHTLIG